MKQRTGLFFLSFLVITAFSQDRAVDSIRMFYLGGQSNMDGFGYNHELPDSLSRTFENVWIFHGNHLGDEQEIGGGIGIWEQLKPGHGTKFYTDGDSNFLFNRFGVELSFAKRLQELYPGEKLAIIKYSRGGTSLDSNAASWYGSWEPDFRGTNGINQYDYFLNTLRNALQVKDIDGDGTDDFLIPSGIFWMHGESDGKILSASEKYGANLKRLMDLIRAAFRQNDLPVVIGKISDSAMNQDQKIWKYGSIVQQKQEEYVAGEINAAIIRDTEKYTYSDPWHYDSESTIDLGLKFADAVYLILGHDHPD